MANKKTCIKTQEEKINAKDLSQDMLLILKDYFCCKFTVNDNGIAIKMDNGQLFQIIIEEM